MNQIPTKSINDRIDEQFVLRDLDKSMLSQLKQLHSECFPDCNALFGAVYYERLLSKIYPSLLLIDKLTNKVTAMSTIVANYIYAFGVSKSYRRRGLGSYLFEKTVEYIDNTGNYKYVGLNVNTDNIAAIKLYEKYGFHIENVITDFYPYCDHKDAFSMRKWLKVDCNDDVDVDLYKHNSSTLSLLTLYTVSTSSNSSNESTLSTTISLRDIINELTPNISTKKQYNPIYDISVDHKIINKIDLLLKLLNNYLNDNVDTMQT